MKRVEGFTYLSVLILVAVISILSTATVQVGSLLEQRAAEEELLSIGREFHNALISYARASPEGQPKFPSSLAELLKDPRYPDNRRHLRKLYVDPLTGRAAWGIVKFEGRIVGIYSLSGKRPIKIANFDAVRRQFSGATTYQAWVFTSIPNWTRLKDRMVFGQ